MKSHAIAGPLSVNISLLPGWQFTVGNDIFTKKLLQGKSVLISSADILCDLLLVPRCSEELEGQTCPGITARLLPHTSASRSGCGVHAPAEVL